MRSTSRRSESPDRIEAVRSDWMRSRRDTGDGTSGGAAPAGWCAGDGRRPRVVVRLSRWFPRRRPASRSALLRAGVLLALGFLALALHARLLVVLATASLRED